MGDRMIGRQIFSEIRLLVGNEHGFVHRKLLGGISKLTGFLPGPIAGAVSSITGRLASSRARKQVAQQIKFGPEPDQAFVRTRGVGEKRAYGEQGAGSLVDCLVGYIRSGDGRRCLPTFAGNGGGGGRTDCPPPLVRGPMGLCLERTSPVGAARLGGEATMGQYGAAMIPGSQIVDRATCLRGMQLGNDGLCYNKSQIRNNQRMWPAGRKPLLSGGDMRAISTAARAGRRMELATKRLQKMGMMKRPARRGVPAGHRARLVHASEH